MVELTLTDRQIPIIADEYVDMEFGTGVVKITPAHDPNDFEVGKRHNLPEINILNDDATINNLGGKYAGMDRYEARKAMVADLEAQGLLVRVEDHVHNVGTHDRCKTTVEPMIKQQWFVKMDELIKPAVEGVKNGDIELMPASMDKTYFNWTDQGLVYFKTALVGTQNPGILLQGLRRDDSFKRSSMHLPEVRQ